MPAGSRLAPVADVADGQSRDGGPELVIRGEHPVIAMPVLPRRRDEIRQPIEKLKRIRPRRASLSAARRA